MASERPSPPAAVTRPPLKPAPTVEHTDDADPVDAVDEKFCRDCRDELIAIAKGQQELREDNGSQDRIGAATVAKLYDTALKWHRAMRDVHDKRADKQKLADMIDHERQMTVLGRRGAAH